MKSDVWTKFVQTSDFMVKALIISNSLYHRNFEMKTAMNVKTGSYTKLCTQNKILDSKMQHLKQQKTFVFAPLILKRWIIAAKQPSIHAPSSSHLACEIIQAPLALLPVAYLLFIPNNICFLSVVSLLVVFFLVDFSFMIFSG